MCKEHDAIAHQWGNYGQLGIGYLSAGLTMGGTTAPVGIGIGLVDMVGGFNGFYNYLDNQQHMYNTSGGLMLPGPTGLPVFTPITK